jgi:hypothetical protein
MRIAIGRYSTLLEAPNWKAREEIKDRPIAGEEAIAYSRHLDEVDKIGPNDTNIQEWRYLRYHGRQSLPRDEAISAAS